MPLALCIRSGGQFKKLWSWTWRRRRTQRTKCKLLLLRATVLQLEKKRWFPSTCSSLHRQQGRSVSSLSFKVLSSSIPQHTQWWWSSQFWWACSYQHSMRVGSRAQYGSIQLHRSQVSQQRKRTCVLLRVCFNLDASPEEGTPGALLRGKLNKVMCFIDVGLFGKQE